MFEHMNLTEISKKTTPIFDHYGVTKASVFGSVSRGEDTAISDIDILVTLGRPMGMVAYMHLQQELENVLQKKIDLVTEKSLSRHMKPYIMSDLKIIYER